MRFKSFEFCIRIDTLATTQNCPRIICFTDILIRSKNIVCIRYPLHNTKHINNNLCALFMCFLLFFLFSFFLYTNVKKIPRPKHYQIPINCFIISFYPIFTSSFMSNQTRSNQHNRGTIHIKYSRASPARDTPDRERLPHFGPRFSPQRYLYDPLYLILFTNDISNCILI